MMNRQSLILGGLCGASIGLVYAGIFMFPLFFPDAYAYNKDGISHTSLLQNGKNGQSESRGQKKMLATVEGSTSTIDSSRVASSTSTAPVFVITHVPAPTAIKAIYMTSWVAGVPKLRTPLVDLIDTTEINAVVIDVKDYSGKISFEIENPELKKYGSQEIRIRDLRQFVEMLHEKHIYVIARVATFQDAYMVKVHPQWAVENAAGTAVWKDHKGISWIDASSRDYWHYIILVAQEAYGAGFDEINFDYIRFPSDGNMKDISYPWSKDTPKSEVLISFFKYINEQLKNTNRTATTTIETGTTTPTVNISADLFGMTTTATNDMGIGQIFASALPYFDYIDPMVYPSHYPQAFLGYKNPAQYPYEVVNYALAGGVKRALLASSSPLKIRPWLQDFSLGARYGSAEVRKQIKATYDNKLTSWLLWSASNVYTKGALDAQ